MPSSKHRRKGKPRMRKWSAKKAVAQFMFTDKGREFAVIANRAMEMFGIEEPSELTHVQWEAATVSINAEVETWNAMEAIACDALGVEVPPITPWPTRLA